MQNRLRNEKSPYLLQHAGNPVDWYPWGDEAFERARELDRLIFLSIGYSTCHWCHVMERESFENPEIAALLNDRFVAIKVDREERPDIDRIYMSALQATGEDGGWPLSIFLTPDRKPVWGGTYFPPEPRHGRAGFPDILRRVDELWRTDREQVIEAGERIAAYLSDLSRNAPAKGEGKSADFLEECFQQFRKTYDAEWGGFGKGPKFPRPSVFFFLLRYYHRTKEPAALEMVEQTLRKMIGGGINDQIGGGFHRYSVDREWRVPHFEKMLYDQAQILLTLADVAQITHEPGYASAIREVCSYVLRDLTHPDGGFYSAEDADSPLPADPARKGEGAFYLWSYEELEKRLGDDAGLFCAAFGIRKEGNIPFDPHQEFGQTNIPYLPLSLDVIAGQFKSNREEIDEILKGARAKLLQARSRRPRPLRDDKIIASWNGLMISALSRAGAVLHEEEYLRAARRGAEFVFSRLYDPWNRVLRKRWRDGDLAVAAHLEDFAFLACGFLDLYEATGEIAWFRGAVRFADDMVAGFWDREEGGFFTTDGKDPSVLVRLKEQYDGAEPGGNSVGLLVLLRLGRMTGNKEWVEMASRGIEGLSGILESRPVMLPYLAGVAETLLAPPVQIVLAGNPEGEGMGRLLRGMNTHFLPSRVVYFADGGAGQAELTGMAPELQGMTMIGGKPTAYVCRNFVCALPTSDPAEFSAQLGSQASSGL